MLTRRSAVHGGVGVGLGALLLAVLALANYLSAKQFFHRFDLTQGKQYTVSPSTKRILGSLDDVVNVKMYFSKNLPEQASSVPMRVKDLLAELEAYGKGKLKVESVDPQSSPETEAKVRSLGIPRIPLMVLEKHEQRTVEVYLGLAILYADKKEVIPAVLDDTNLEYEIMSAVLRMTRPKKRLGFLAGHEERDPFRDYATFSERLREQYEVETVDLSDGKPVPEKVSALVVAGPRQPIDDRARYEIDQFLMRGGHALFLVDTFAIDPRSLTARPVELGGLADQLASYGVRVKPALVADWGLQEVVQVPAQNELGGAAGGYYIEPYPLWPKVHVSSLSEASPITNRLPGLVLPWTAPLEVTKGDGDAFTVTELVKSTVYARAEEQIFSAHPRSLATPEEKDLKQYTLAAAVTGPIRSFFRDKPVPAAKQAADEAASPSPAPGLLASESPSPTPSTAPEAELPRKDTAEAAQIVVVGSSEFLSDPLLRQRSFAVNLVFAQNAVDWLMSGDELIGIRSRTSEEPMLDPRRRKAGEDVIPWINLLLVPALVVAFGIVWRTARRRQRVVLS